MGGEELRELETSISNVRHVCKTLKYSCIVSLAVFITAWATLSGIMVLDIVLDNPQSTGYQGLIYVALYGLVIGLLLLEAYRSFSDIVSGESPFTMKQVSRFQVSAILLMLLAIIDAFFSTNFSYDAYIGGIPVGALGNDGKDQSYTSVNIMAMFFAIVLYGVSVLFRYGVLLQRLTDETD